MSRNGVARYKLRNGSVRYRVRVYHHGRRYKWSGFLVKSEATDFYYDRKRDIRAGRPFPRFIEEPTSQPRTVAQMIDDYLVTAKIKKNYEGELGYAKFWKQQHGPKICETVTATDVDLARKVLLKRGTGPATINRYAAWYHHVFRLEVEADRLAKNPCRLFVRSSHQGGQRLPERPAPDVVWTDEQLDQLLKELGVDIAYPLLAMLTGLRREEQFSLRKDALDLERRIGWLHDTKSGANQVFHLNDDAVRIIRHFIRRSGDSPFLFPSRRWPHTKPMSGQHWYASVFKPACGRAGIVIDRKVGRTWHTLRHSFGDRLANLGVPVLDIQESGRWSSFQVMRRYLKKNNERVRAAVGKLKSPIKLDHFLYSDLEEAISR